ncbi:RNA polymerase sigma factor RpoD/SigA [Candidatus Woesearchaeota archaeon]|nr:RNA polymerase sigma factor RpoD/SigA [Candidatus Woesearchaeota archaeon]
MAQTATNTIKSSSQKPSRQGADFDPFRRHSLDIYLQTLEDDSLLAPEEELDLVREMNRHEVGTPGYIERMHELVNANRRFVVTVAKAYQGYGLGLEDLVQEGNIGLIEAVRRFDETRGFRLISYAVWWIRQSILEAINKYGRTVRLPTNQQAELSKIRKVEDYLEQTKARDIDYTELAAEVGMRASELQGIMAAGSFAQSFDRPVGDDHTFHDLYSVHGAAEVEKPLLDASLRAEVDHILGKFPGTTRSIIRSYFGLDGPRMTLDEIASDLRITKGRAKDYLVRGIRALRKPPYSTLLKQYLG